MRECTARAVGLLIKESGDVKKKEKVEVKKKKKEGGMKRTSGTEAQQGELKSRFRLDQQVKGERRESK